MDITFITPYNPNPRILKRLKAAKSVANVNIVYWDRGTDESYNIELLNSENINNIRIDLSTNDGNPLKRVFKSFKFAFRAFRQLKKDKPQIIHVTKTDMLISVFFYSVFYDSKVKIIYEVSDIHTLALNNVKGFLPNLLKHGLYNIERMCFKRVSKLIVTSPLFYDKYYNNLIEKENVLFLSNSPNELVFDNYNYTLPQKFTISFIGKVRYTNQLKMLIDIAEKKGFNILIAGDGIGLNEIEEYSKGKSFVTITGAYNYKKDIVNLYEQSSAIYSVYDPEILNVKIALPNRLYEAAKCGKPLIVAKGTYLEKIVLENKLGISVSANNPNDLLASISKLKDNYFLSEVKEAGNLFYSKYSGFENQNKFTSMLRCLLYSGGNYD